MRYGLSLCQAMMFCLLSCGPGGEESPATQVELPNLDSMEFGYLEVFDSDVLVADKWFAKSIAEIDEMDGAGSSTVLPKDKHVELPLLHISDVGPNSAMREPLRLLMPAALEGLRHLPAVESWGQGEISLASTLLSFLHRFDGCPAGEYRLRSCTVWQEIARIRPETGAVPTRRSVLAGSLELMVPMRSCP